MTTRRNLLPSTTRERTLVSLRHSFVPFKCRRNPQLPTASCRPQMEGPSWLQGPPSSPAATPMPGPSSCPKPNWAPTTASSRDNLWSQLKSLSTVGQRVTCLWWNNWAIIDTFWPVCLSIKPCRHSGDMTEANSDTIPSLSPLSRC